MLRFNEFRERAKQIQEEAQKINGIVTVVQTIVEVAEGASNISS